MKVENRYTLRELEKVVDTLTLQLRLKLSDRDIEEVFSQLSFPPPDKEVCRHVRTLFESEIEKKMQRLCSDFTRRFKTQPEYKDLAAALVAAGYTCTRGFQIGLMTMLKEKNSDRWVQRSKVKSVRFTDAEYAMWDALRRTFDLRPGEVAPMLLRMFAVTASSGKINLLEIPYLTGSLTDKDLEKYTQSLNFTVQKTPKSRV